MRLKPLKTSEVMTELSVPRPPHLRAEK